MSGLRRLRGDIAHNRTTARRYAMAVVVTALALLLALGVQGVTHLRTNLLLLAPVAISAWYGGHGPGILASALSIAAIILTFDPTHRAALDVPGVGEVVYVTTFVVVALIIGRATESLRAERAKAVGRARQLEQLQETTAELARVQTASEVVDVVLGRGLGAIGATRGFFARVDGPAVEV